MQSFSTEGYRFEIDGQEYEIPYLGFGDLEASAAISNASNQDRVKIMRDLIASKIDAETLRAIDRLRIPDALKLVKAWIGLEPGESSTSGE